MIIIKALALIIVIAVFLTIIAPWLTFLFEEYLDWTDDVIVTLREKKYKAKMKIGDKNEK